jgi:hypothetical protein
MMAIVEARRGPDGARNVRKLDPLVREWAIDLTRLTWAGWDVVGATSHAIAPDFPQICEHNQRRETQVRPDENSWAPAASRSPGAGPERPREPRYRGFTLGQRQATRVGGSGRSWASALACSRPMPGPIDHSQPLGPGGAQAGFCSRRYTTHDLGRGRTGAPCRPRGSPEGRRTTV